jgi:tyrosine-protein phosphatase SIW14
MLTRTKTVIVSLAAIALIAAAFFGWGLYQHIYYYHFKTVKSGVLYRSGEPSTTSFKSIYARTHFKSIVILRSKVEIAKNTQDWYGIETNFAKQHGVKVHVIYSGADIPPTNKQVNQFVNIVNDPANQPVLVHCAQGVIRTGMMVAAYRLKVMHESAQQVLATFPLFGHTLTDHPEVAVFIKQYEQHLQAKRASNAVT